MSHTPEPWAVDDACTIIVDGEYLLICDTSSSSLDNADDVSNASRIVACVNACKNVDNETLVAIANGTMIGSEIHELAQVKAERDTYRELCGELLEALKFHQQQTRPINRSKIAITRAEAVMGENSNG